MARDDKPFIQIPYPNGSHHMEGRKIASFDKSVLSVQSDTDSITVIVETCNGVIQKVPSGYWLHRHDGRLCVLEPDEKEMVQDYFLNVIKNEIDSLNNEPRVKYSKTKLDENLQVLLDNTPTPITISTIPSYTTLEENDYPLTFNLEHFNQKFSGKTICEKLYVEMSKYFSFYGVQVVVNFTELGFELRADEENVRLLKELLLGVGDLEAFHVIPTKVIRIEPLLVGLKQEPYDYFATGKKTHEV